MAAHGLSGRPELPQAPLNDATWRALLHGAARQRVQGHLADAIMSGGMAAGPDQRHEALIAHRDALTHVVRAEGLLCQVADLLDGAGIDYRVLKGPATSRLDYATPTLRVFGDIDVLVRPCDLERALAVLAASGGVRSSPEIHSAFDRRFGKAVCLVLPNRMELDVHSTLATEPFGLLLDRAGLFGAAANVCLAGREIPCLGVTHRLLHACYHAALGRTERTLVPLRDVAQIVQRDDLDDLGVLKEAERWSGCAVVASALLRVEDVLAPLPERPLTAWARRYHPTRLERWALSAYDYEARARGRRALVTVVVLPGVRRRVGYVRSLLAPSSDFTAWRGGYLGWLRRAASRPSRP